MKVLSLVALVAVVAFVGQTVRAEDVFDYQPKDCNRDHLQERYEECARFEEDSIDRWTCLGLLNQFAHYCITNEEAVKTIDLEHSFWKDLVHVSENLFKGDRAAVFNYLKSLE